MQHIAPAFIKPVAVWLGLMLALPAVCQAWELQGTKTIIAHTRDQQHLPIGSVSFVPRNDGRVAFTMTMDHGRFTDYFLSMKEFKCLSSPLEVSCHVPYPYPQPGTVTVQDLAWLAHSLLFLYKLPTEFGAKLWNGVYFRFSLTGQGLLGKPMAVDLNRISAPPDDLTTPPFGPNERDAIPAATRWLESITIE